MNYDDKLKYIIDTIPADSTNNPDIELLNKGYNEWRWRILNINDSIKLEISYYNLKNKVKLAGYNKNPYKYINSCDLFILSSLYEGLPNVLLEAGILGKLIISSFFGCCKISFTFSFN